MRFDEVELEPAIALDAVAEPERLSSPIFRRVAAILVDLSLFAALALALSPLLPASMNSLALAGLAGFVVLVSYYYFVGTWVLWGKTLGGAIFDVRVPSAMSLRRASVRWLVLWGSVTAASAGVLLYFKA